MRELRKALHDFIDQLSDADAGAVLAAIQGVRPRLCAQLDQEHRESWYPRLAGEGQRDGGPCPISTHPRTPA